MIDQIENSETPAGKEYSEFIEIIKQRVKSELAENVAKLFVTMSPHIFSNVDIETNLAPPNIQR